MSLSTYAELQDAILSLLHRDGDTEAEALAPTWILLAESELQTKCKVMEFETSGNISVTAGVGSLPSGFLSMRSVYWDDDTDNTLEYIAPELFDALRNNEGTPQFYTLTGSSFKVSPYDTGTAVATYSARFTALSDVATTNALLTSFPDAYLYGAMKHACVWAADDANLQKYGVLFNAACDRINLNNEQRKYGGALQVRAR